MNPKRNSGLLERDQGHHVCQVMDLALGGTPQHPSILGLHPLSVPLLP